MATALTIDDDDDDVKDGYRDDNDDDGTRVSADGQDDAEIWTPGICKITVISLTAGSFCTFVLLLRRSGW